MYRLVDSEHYLLSLHVEDNGYVELERSKRASRSQEWTTTRIRIHPFVALNMMSCLDREKAKIKVGEKALDGVVTGRDGA